MPFFQGWVESYPEVIRTCYEMGADGSKVYFGFAAPHLVERDDNAPVFFWHAEQKIIGQVLPSFDQGSIGSCVGNGYGRATQDLMLIQSAAGISDWPGTGPDVPSIYGGSRVEVGGGRLGIDRNGRNAGSVGAWAAKWLKDWGVLLRKPYAAGGQTYDLREYSVARCRQYGNTGVPDALEPIAREHPVSVVALTRTGAEVWAAIGAGKPVALCSSQGFTTGLRNGFCEPQGTWQHCMCVRGRFTHPTRGRCFVLGNSWGNYLAGDRGFDSDAGRQVLPEGCFCTTFDTVERMALQSDSFALAGVNGWERTVIDNSI